MDLLFISPVFYPAWDYGGIVPASFQLINELSNQGVDITVYTTDALSRNMRQENSHVLYGKIDVHYYKNLNNNFAWNRIFLPIQLKYVLENSEKDFDIVHMLDYRFISNIFAYKYIKKYDLSYVMTPLNPFNNYFRKGFLKKVFDLYGKKILQDANVLIAQSDFEAESFIKFGIPLKRIQIIPNGIDLDVFKKTLRFGIFRELFKIPKSIKMILYLGRIDYIKGPDKLVLAFARILKIPEMKNIVLVIAGPDAGYQNELKKLISRLNIVNNVIFTGSLRGDIRLAAYQDADVFVLPSRYEEFGIAPLEAFACGTPVIITENCGVNYWMKNFFDKIIQNGIDDLYRALIDILVDSDYKSRINRKERLEILEKDFSWEVIAGRLRRIYDHILRRY